MLFWAEDGNEVVEIGKTRRKFFETAKARLTPEEFSKIKDFINSDIDSELELIPEGQDKVYVPGWRAPSEWSGIPLQAIYDTACNNDSVLSALFYGLVTMEVIIERGEAWFGYKTQFEGRAFEQATYWLREG